MRFLALFIACSFSFASIGWGQTTITQWNFGPSTPDGTLVPSTGVGTASLVGDATSTYAAGVTGTAWNTSTYPTQSNGSGTRGVQFAVSTVGYENIEFSFQHRASGTASRYARVDYSLNAGATWVNGFWSNNGGISPHDIFYQFTVNFTSVTGANDNPDFVVRVVSVFAPCAFTQSSTLTYSADQAYMRANSHAACNPHSTTNNGNYAANGTWRFDDVTFSGDVISGTPILTVSDFPSDPLCTHAGNNSANSSFTLSGSDFTSATGNITVTAPAGFHVSTSAASGFAASINIPFTGSALAATTVYLRIPAATAAGAYSGDVNVSCATCGVAAQDFTVTGYVHQLTYPTPHDLGASNYTFTNWPAGSAAGTYPAGMVLHMGTDPSAGTFNSAAVGTMNYDVAYNLGTRSRVNGLGPDGLSFIATGNGQFNNGSSGQCNVDDRFATSAIVPLNTTDRQSISVSWTAGTVTVSDNNRVFTLRLQYRIGQSGNFTDVAGGAYSSSTAGHSQTFSNIILPAECDDQPEVQVRWVYYQTGGDNGSRPQLRLDDITVTSSPLACTVPDQVTALTATPDDGEVALTWTNGDCFDEMLVVARATSAVSFTPTGDGAVYAPNPVFGDGFDVGSAQHVVFNANGSSVTVTGLTNGTTYHFAVYTRRGTSWTAAVTASATPFEPAYYWNGGNTAASPANGGSGNWGDANAWRQPTSTGAQSTWANGNRAILGGTAGTIVLDANRTTLETRVLTTGYTVSTPNSTARQHTGPIDLGNDRELTFSINTGGTGNGVIRQEGDIDGSGTSRITILKSQDNSDNVRLEFYGTSNVQTPIRMRGNGTGNIALSSYGNLTVGNVELDASLGSDNFSIGGTGGNTVNVNGVVSGNGNLRFANGGSGGAAVINMNAQATYTGDTDMRSTITGVVNAGLVNALPLGTTFNIGSGASPGTFNLNGFNQALAGITSTSTGTSRGVVNTGAAATLTLNGTGDYVYNANAGIGIPANTTNITGANNSISIVKAGSGTQVFEGALTYTGTTTINGGTLLLDGSLAAGSAVSVNGGTLAGSGTAAGTVTVSANSSLSPGGTVSGSTTSELNTGVVTFQANSRVVIDINNAGGTAGAASGWDKVTSSGGVNITATSGSPVEIVLHGRTAANSPGTVPNFNNGVGYDWVIVSGTTISGYAADRFTVNASGFENNNALAGGSFSVVQVGNDLVLRFTSTAASTVYSRGSGNSESAAIWSLTPTGTGQTIAALGGFATNRSWVIQNGHAVELGASNTPVENLTINSGGRLWRNSNTPGNLRYVNMYGNLVNNGAIGNGAANDAIGFNIEGDNCEFSGSGAFDILRIRKSEIANVVSNLTINANVNLRWGGSGLYNNRNSSDLNVTVAAGRVLDVIGSDGTDGDVAMDGISGTAGERGGVVTVNGTLRVSRKIFAVSDNSVRQCGWAIGPNGRIETRDIDAEQHAFNTFTISNGGALQVAGTMAVKAGSINSNGGILLLNGAQLLHGAGTPAGGGDVTGNITVRRQGTSVSNVYNYWSTPVAGGVLPGSNGHWYDAAEGSLAQDNSSGGDNGWQPFSGAMTTGRGYASTGGGLANFTGVANNGNLDIAVTSSPGSPFNLIGNPYPSAINANTFVTTNSGVIAGVLYFWSNSSTATSNYTTNDYAVWSPVGSVSPIPPTSAGASGPVPNGFIPVGQGFKVEAISGGNVSFTNAMRGGDNSQFFRMAEYDEFMDRIWLSMAGNGHFNQTLVAFRDDATDLRDVMYDAYKVRGDANISLGAMQADEAFAIAAYPTLTAERTVPLMTFAAQQGTYTFRADSLDGFQGYTVYLEDLQSGQLHTLGQGDGVTVQMGPQDEYDRFRLRFSPELVTGTGGAAEAGGRILCTGSALQVQIEGVAHATGELRLIDALGRTLMHRALTVTDGLSPYCDVTGHAAGVYFAEFRSEAVVARGRFVLR